MCHVDPEFVERLTESLPPETAEPVGVGTLALSHLVPGGNPASRWRRTQRGFSGHLVVGEDLKVIPVGRARRTS
ncbi:hypothetical protein [Nocardioides sp.]|uniref:hypothetical protein n=1 Tax=Nocardioides sp. TaxID=35761 RepID=UPI0019CBE5E2|nr:hypothetical protein [Nocardioides sp.]MBC7276400.1 hypothetical protein [Nocardioides sp.]